MVLAAVPKGKSCIEDVKIRGFALPFCLPEVPNKVQLSKSENNI